MRNLLRFIFKHHFVFLFVLIEIFSLFLVVRYNNPHRAKFLASSNLFVGALNSGVNTIGRYFNLVQVNKTLAQENASLRNRLRKSKFELLVKHEVVNDSTYAQQYLYIPAEVINNSTSRQKNYITINRGSRHGVEKDMGVISSNGVVGIVNSVSRNFATVLSILNRNYKVSAKFAANNYFGSVYWDGRDPNKVKLADIPYHVDVRVGQKIVTNAFSNIYPAGVYIGLVDTFSIDNHENFYDIDVSLATDFRNLEYVYVIKDLLKIERQKLEKGSKE